VTSPLLNNRKPAISPEIFVIETTFSAIFGEAPATAFSCCHSSDSVT
jgi:hypothetical protein